MKFCNLHLHDHYSALDGVGSPKEYMDRAAEIGMTHLAQTNHGTLMGHREFQREAKSAGITPILGLEAYLTTDRFDKTAQAKRQEGDLVYNHLTLLAQNENGLHNLNYLSEQAWTTGFYQKPRCLPPGTEVTTKSGMKYIEDIKLGDEVLSHDGTFNRVTRIYENNYEGLLYGLNISSRYGKTLWFTDDHPVLIIDNKTKEESWVKAKDVVAGRRNSNDEFSTWNSLVATPRVNFSNDINEIDVSSCSGHWKHLHDSRWIKKNVRKTIKDSNHYCNIVPKIDLDYDFGFFIGLYVAEGWTDKGGIGLALHEKETELVDAIDRVYGKLTGKTCSVYKKQDPNYHGQTVRIYHSILTQIIKKIIPGKCASDKMLPEWLFDSNENFARGCFDGVLAGDGHEYEGHFSLGQTSIMLAWQMRTLGVTFSGGFSRVATNESSQGFENGKAVHTINISKAGPAKSFVQDDKYSMRPVHSIETKSYAGKVYNIEVENTHTYVTDIITHNCDFELLEDNNQDIIALSGCLSGMIPKALTAGNEERANELMHKFLDIFGERFFIEIMDSNPKELNLGLMALADKYNVKPVVTDDCHHVRKEDSWIQEAILILNTNPKFAKTWDMETAQKMDFLERFNYVYPDRKMTLQDFDLFLHTYEDHEIALAKQGIGTEPIENTMLIAESIGEYPYYEGLDLLPAPKGDPKAILRKKVYAGLKRLGKDTDQVYIDRVEHELEIIGDKNFDSYFLLAENAITWAESKDIMVGPGRGSAAGSLVCYCLGITKIDPIEYNLLFMRFLDPSRGGIEYSYCPVLDDFVS